MDEIALECRRTLAAVKNLPVETVMPQSTLEELGLDSLDRVSLSFDLEEKYKVEIPDSRLAEIRTVGDVVDAVHEALARSEAKRDAKAAADAESKTA